MYALLLAMAVAAPPPQRPELPQMLACQCAVGGDCTCGPDCVCEYHLTCRKRKSVTVQPQDQAAFLAQGWTFEDPVYVAAPQSCSNGQCNVPARRRARR